MHTQVIENPFLNKDKEHAKIWEMLLKRDIQAFKDCNWEHIQNDFLEDRFFGINAKFTNDPTQWSLTFPTLRQYKACWLKQAHESARKEYYEPLNYSLHKVSYLDKIEIQENKAAVWKKFNGTIKLKDGTEEKLDWQTIYICEKSENSWKITSFVGYLPISVLQLGVASSS